MALTKVSRGLLSTSIVDNGNATAITIDSSENVGIGTSSPSTALDVVGTATMDGLTVENTASAVARLETTDTSVIADQEIGALEYSQADASGAGAGVKASIRAKSGNSTGAQTYIAVHASSSSVNDLEVLRVDHTGIDVTGSVTADSLTIDTATSDWQFSVSGDDLIISYGGVSKAKLTTTGDLVVTGNVTAFGTI